MIALSGLIEALSGAWPGKALLYRPETRAAMVYWPCRLESIQQCRRVHQHLEFLAA